MVFFFWLYFYQIMVNIFLDKSFRGGGIMNAEKRRKDEEKDARYSGYG